MRLNDYPVEVLTPEVVRAIQDYIGSVSLYVCKKHTGNATENDFMEMEGDYCALERAVEHIPDVPKGRQKLEEFILGFVIDAIDANGK